MLFLIAAALFLIVVGTTWWYGFWNNLIGLINFFIAALTASAFYENVAAYLVEVDGSYRMIIDFVALWLTFFVAFGVMRTATDILTRIKLKFHPAVDIIGRSIASVWLGLAFVSFTFFSLHLSALPPNMFQPNQDWKAMGIGPDRFWLAFVQSRSRGALATHKDSAIFGEYWLPTHPDDQGLDSRVFDPVGRFIFEHAARRKWISEISGLRVE